MVEIKKECDFYKLKSELWSGAIDTINAISKHKKAGELMFLLQDIFYEATDITTINDFLWFAGQSKVYGTKKKHHRPKCGILT